jgi:hypothetical protein
MLENVLSKFVKLLLVLMNLLLLNALLNVLLMPSFKDLVASTNFFKFQHNKVPFQGNKMVLQVSVEQNNHGGVMLVYHLISQIVSLTVLIGLQTNKNLRF